MTVRIGIIGLGFMGRTHLAAYRTALASGMDIALVAAADVNIDRVGSHKGGNLNTAETVDLSGMRTAADFRAVLEADDIDAISICTPTDTHVDLASLALRAGKHVLLEKPVALLPSDVLTLKLVAESSGKRCMPAMCMRFWPGWSWLKNAIATKEYGNVLSATFHRLGSAPDWNPAFYGNPEKSGGALFDLHIHDADFITWCFGAPDSVSSTGSLRHVSTHYRFHGGPAHVVAEGGQDHAPGFGFRMRFLVAFEHAAAEFDLGRSPQLTLFRNGTSETIPTDGPSGYEAEIAHFIEAVRDPSISLKATLDDAHLVTRVLTAERQSLKSGQPEKP